MPDFYYKALTSAGAVEEGWISAPDVEAVESRIRMMGNWLVEAEPRARPTAKHTDAVVSRKELLAFLEYLAGAFDVGVPILTVLDDVQLRLGDKRLIRILGEVRRAVSEEGKSLSQAMSEHPKAFPQLYIATISAGEASGQLGFALRQLVDYLDWQEGISSQIKQATTYPAIVLVAIALLVLGLISFVFPRITPLLTARQIDLPLPTRVLMAVSVFLREDWRTVIIGIAVLAIAIAAASKTVRGRRAIDVTILRLPVIGEFVREVSMARIVTYLGLFYRTGVEIVLALSLVERMVSNVVVAEAMRGVRESVVGGETMAAAFGHHRIFPRIVVRAVALGETTGRLDESLGRARDYYAREIPAAVKRLVTILQPALIVLLGGVILLVALSIILPILSIYNSIGVRT